MDPLASSYTPTTSVTPCGAAEAAATRKRAKYAEINHSQLNDLMWRAVKRAQIPATKEPIGLSRSDGKRPDGASLIPWKRGKPLAWHVTVPDTYAASHIGETPENAGAASNKAATNEIAKYNSLITTHYFIPIAIETAGPWNTEASEFIVELRQESHRSNVGTLGNAISILALVHSAAERKRDSAQKDVMTSISCGAPKILRFRWNELEMI